MSSSWFVVEEEGVEMPPPLVPPAFEVLLDSGAAPVATGFGFAGGALMAMESSSFLSSPDSPEDESALNNKSSMLPLMMITDR
jgi:hypothetical protein